jgi:hypothetical protein
MNALLAIVFSVATAVMGPSCGEELVSSHGMKARVLFARNGAVERYIITGEHQNPEDEHDFLLALQKRGGPEGINAPPLRITAFKQGYGGVAIPVRGVDSCGRTLTFQ